MVALSDVNDVLREIPDPEMPISIVDLGIVGDVRIIPSGAVEIDILPTFIGCPALPMIEREIRQRVAQLPGVGGVTVRFLYDPPWSTDRVTPAGRESLRRFGVTAPGAAAPGEALVPLGLPQIAPATDESAAYTDRPAEAVPCPHCGSGETRLTSPFGPTRCRMIYYCDACRNAFEHLKRV